MKSRACVSPSCMTSRASVAAATVLSTGREGKSGEKQGDCGRGIHQAVRHRMALRSVRGIRLVSLMLFITRTKIAYALLLQ